MKKATTIEEGSCSRIARPRKALDRRAQCRPSSTVSPKRKKEALERINIPASVAAIVLRRIEPLIRRVSWLFNRSWLDQVFLSAYMQGLMDGERVWRKVFEQEQQIPRDDVAQEWP